MSVRYAAIAEFCLLAACLLAVASLGGAAPFALTPHALLSFAALLFTWLFARGAGEALRLPKLALLFVAGAGVCLLQLIPLPLPLLSAASPQAAELVSFNLQPLGLSATRPISLEPSATARELHKALSYAALLISAAHLCRARPVRRRAFFIVSLLGAAVALTAVVHALLGEEALFGLYRFSNTPQLVTPFGNPNHLAGFLTVTATLTLGLFLELRGPPVRLALALMYLLQASVCMFSGSRAGIVFFVAAQLVLAGLAFRTRRDSHGSINSRVLAAGFVVCALSVAAYVGFERLRGEYQSADSVEKVRESKVKQWPDFARGAAFYSRLGMGRGAFDVGYERHQPRASYYRFTHPENAVLQLWAEFGMLAAMALILFGAWAFGLLFLKDEPSLTDFAALAATAAVALHNLFDFSFELLAVPSVLALLLGAVSRRGEVTEGVVLSRRRADVAVAVCFALIVFGLVRGRHSYALAEQQLLAAISATTSAKEAEAAALPLIDQHPADARLYSAVGLAYANDRRANPTTALAWLNRGLYLSPWNGPSHHAVARALLRAGSRNQAFGEYRLALQSYGRPEPVIREVVTAAKSAEELVRATPRTADFVLAMANAANGVKPHAVIEAALRALISEVAPERSRIPLLVRLASVRRALNDDEGALAALDEAQALKPEEASVSILRAELLAAAGREAEATALLEAEVTRYPGDFRLHMATVGFHLPRDTSKALVALGRARAFADSMEQQFEVFFAEARAYQRSDRTARALQSAQAAAQLAPKRADVRYLVADLFARMGRFKEARLWLNDAMAQDTPDGAKANLAARQAQWAAEEARVVELKDKAILEGGPDPQLRNKEEL